MATPKKSPNKSFTAFVKINLDLGVTISGATLEEALENARKLGVTDVVDLGGLDHNDSDIHITGIYEA